MGLFSFKSNFLKLFLSGKLNQGIMMKISLMILAAVFSLPSCANTINPKNLKYTFSSPLKKKAKLAKNCDVKFYGTSLSKDRLKNLNLTQVGSLDIKDKKFHKMKLDSKKVHKLMDQIKPTLCEKGIETAGLHMEGLTIKKVFFYQ